MLRGRRTFRASPTAVSADWPAHLLPAVWNFQLRVGATSCHRAADAPDHVALPVGEDDLDGVQPGKEARHVLVVDQLRGGVACCVLVPAHSNTVVKRGGKGQEGSAGRPWRGVRGAASALPRTSCHRDSLEAQRGAAGRRRAAQCPGTRWRA